MDIVIDRHHGAPLTEEEIITHMHEEGLTPHGWGNAPGERTAGMSTATRRCCTASAARSSSTQIRATLISDPKTGWCCHHTRVTQPPSAQRACAALKHPARVRPLLDKRARRGMSEHSPSRALMNKSACCTNPGRGSSAGTSRAVLEQVPHIWGSNRPAHPLCDKLKYSDRVPKVEPAVSLLDRRHRENPSDNRAPTRLIGRVQS